MFGLKKQRYVEEKLDIDDQPTAQPKVSKEARARRAKGNFPMQSASARPVGKNVKKDAFEYDKVEDTDDLESVDDLTEDKVEQSAAREFTAGEPATEYTPKATKHLRNPLAHEDEESEKIVDNSVAEVQLRKRRVIKTEQKAIEEVSEGSTSAIVFTDAEDDTLTAAVSDGVFYRQDKKSIDISSIDTDGCIASYDAAGNIQLVETSTAGVPAVNFVGEVVHADDSKQQDSTVEVAEDTHDGGCSPDIDVTAVAMQGMALLDVDDMDESEEEPAELIQPAEPVSNRKVVDALRDAVAKYLANYTVDADSAEVQILYHPDCDQQVEIDNTGRHTITLLNNAVYSKGLKMPWNSICEVSIPRNTEVELDFGAGIALPDNYCVMLAPIPQLGSQFGLVTTQPRLIFSAEEARNGLSVKLRAVTSTSYIAKYKRLFVCQIVTAN